ncbi:toll-like receptor 6 [Centruroides sculpturatus]|uniref:toll-like receptor 6 n=1 Tax=Centruroides sculpturatus TaxID=218467 RepID=UPI000C6E3155|nr:toll-like receptor 6 [Centruroides sculpturatus]
MRLVILFPFLFSLVNCCQDFWNQWGNFSCKSPIYKCHRINDFYIINGTEIVLHWSRTKLNSCILNADRCHLSNKHSFVKIFNNTLSVTCSDEETIDFRLMHCLNVKHVKNLEFIDCHLANFDVERFASNYAIEKIAIKYTLKSEYESETLNFESASFINMSSLKYLEIDGVRTFPIFNLSFHGDSSLISLKITHYNFMLFLPRPFQQLKNLSELHVNFGKLKALPKELFHGLYNLKTLDLSYNLIELVHPVVFRHLTLLEQLNLKENPIKRFLHNLLRGLTNLRILSISGNFSELRSVFLKGLDNLTEFRASNFPSLRIEDFFSHSMNLRKIVFDSNQVLHLPSNLLKNNKNLEVFQFISNGLLTLPNGIFDGPFNLKEINMKKNDLDNIPENSFQHLSNLEELDLAYNRLTFLPKNIFLPTKNLRLLDLCGNNFSKISFDFNNKLEKLYLGKAGLTEWPNLNWTKYNLTYVYAAFNHFETVKLPIYTPNRMEIDLDFCHIKTIYIDERKYGFNRPNYQLKKMRLVILFTFLFSLVNCCQHFWNQWGNSSCKSPIYKCRRFGEFHFMNGLETIHVREKTKNNSCISTADRCYTSNRHSSVEILNNSLSVTCSDEETIDFRLMRCLNVKHVKNLEFIDCYLAKFAVERFASNYAIEKIVIKYTSETLNFESASFINMSSLKYLQIEGVRTFGIFNLSFYNDSSLISLKITDYNFTSFPRKPFQQLKNLAKLQLNDGKLKALPEELFHGLYNLKTLDLSNNLIESVHPLVFRHLTLLEQLSLEGNPIISLPEDLLKGLSNLRILSISGNFFRLRSVFLKGLDNLTEFRASNFALLRIEEDFFSHSMNLRKVDFNSNQVLHLPSNLLKNNKNLEVFHCEKNKLSTLPNGIFDGPSNLKEISMKGNVLENIPENSFQRLSNLEELDLTYNRLTFLPKNIFLPTNNLRILRLSHNNFSKISFDFNNKLEELYLEKAGLTEWPNLNWTKYNLTYIDFTGNIFETVKLPIYTPNSLMIDFYFCHIKTIYIDEWKYGFNRPTYELRFNPITCDGELLHFISTVQSNLEISLQIFPDVKDMKCHGEERKLLEYTQFYVIRSHCPQNCQCFSENDELRVDCNRKGIKKIPEFLIENATIVDLSNNYINELSTVDYGTWSKVTRLHLSNNSLLHFPDSVLLPNIKFLWLNGNRLTELPSGLMNLIDVSAEFTVYLSRNDWICDCHSRFTKDWLLRNKRKIADFSHVLCTKNSSFPFFTEIVSGDRCTQISEDNLMSSVNGSDAVNSVFWWRIAVAVLAFLLLFSWIILASFVYCRKKENVDKVLEPKEEEVIYYNVYN